MSRKFNYSSISVLYLIDQVWCGRGGTEQHLNWLLERLPNDAIKKHFIVFSRQIDARDVFPVKPLIFGSLYDLGICSYFRRIFALILYIKKNKIDIIHAFTANDEVVGVVASFFFRNCRVCAHRRNIGYALNAKKKCISRFVQLFKILYIANSEAAKNAAVQNEGINPDRLTVIHNPAFLKRAKEGFENQIKRNDIPVPMECPLIGMVASVRKIKGYEVFLRSAHRVLKKIPNAYFVCVGEQDSYLSVLKDLSKKLNIEERIVWFGSIDNAFRILPHLTIAVLSSHSESFSNSVLEYAIAGKAIVATDVGGMREIITDGESGFLVPPNSPEALADRIVDLLENPEMRKEFGNKARNFVLSNFSEDDILSKYIDFYHKVTC